MRWLRKIGRPELAPVVITIFIAVIIYGAVELYRHYVPSTPAGNTTEVEGGCE